MVKIMDHSRWQLTLVVSINDASILTSDTKVTVDARQVQEEKEVATLKLGTTWQLADFLLGLWVSSNISFRSSSPWE